MGRNLKKHRIGETRMQNCGLEAKIIDYQNNIDITVQFPDGKTVEHKIYNNFVHGRIQHPDADHHKRRIRKKASRRLGEIHLQKCGLKAKIIGYRHTKDMDIQFQDGMIVEHKVYDNFKRGKIAHPTIYDCFHTNIKKIYSKTKSKIYHTQIHGIACVTNDTYYYYCHCPICLAHEIWTFDEIKDHKCNHPLVQEREKQIPTT